jgi:hypothetical protein
MQKDAYGLLIYVLKELYARLLWLNESGNHDDVYERGYLVEMYVSLDYSI